MITTVENKMLIALTEDTYPTFKQSVIYVHNHDDEGAIGFIMNKPLPEMQAEEIIKKLGVGTSGKIYIGGPCDPGMGYVIHTPDYSNNNTFFLVDGIHITTGGGILRDMAMGKGPTDYMMILGHCKWEPDELEHEVDDGVWVVTETHPRFFFTEWNSVPLWRDGVERIAIERSNFILDFYS